MTSLRVFRTLSVLVSALSLSTVSNVPSAGATLVTVTTSDHQLQAGVDNQGWWSSLFANTNPTNDNYSTQNDDFRSFFSFDLSTIHGTVTSATFEVRRYLQSGTATLGLFDVSTPAAILITTHLFNPAIFDELGTGNSYGSFVVNPGPSTDILSFTLNDAALSDIRSAEGQGFFSIGARLLSGDTIFSASNDEPGVSSGSLNSIQRLVLDVQAVPEPGSLVLLGVGLAAFGSTRLRKK